VSLSRIGIIGLGLMGGSLALALRRLHPSLQIAGCGRTALLERARALGAIDRGSEHAAEAVRECDVVFLCTPVESSIRLLAEIAPHLAQDAIVTDVGSTKAAFAEAAREIFGPTAGARVLPGHPLAGSERSGLDHATGELYSGCAWALTPLAAELTPAQKELRALLESLGARIVLISPEEHDRVLAFTSHLPQMLSTALALTLERALHAGSPALELRGSGLHSMLRLAASEPVMWEQIAASNRENIAAALEAFEMEIRHLRESLGESAFRSRFNEACEFARTLRS
jgi:prephenate dehydrogenase